MCLASVPVPMCVCICHLCDCKKIFLVSKDKNKVFSLDAFRLNMWPEPTPLRDKLYGN